LIRNGNATANANCGKQKVNNLLGNAFWSRHRVGYPANIYSDFFKRRFQFRKLFLLYTSTIMCPGVPCQIHTAIPGAFH
jgi:hypothetical protein